MGGKRINGFTNAISQGQDDGLRGYVLGLADACPVVHDNPCDCPLFPLRKMPRKDRLIWLTALTEEEALFLAAYHHVCLGITMESDPPTDKPRS
jgi:hypothetical protein